MANLRNLDRIFTAPIGTAVTVGHNRTIEQTEPNRFTCRLYGHPIVVVTAHGAAGTASVELDACGYLTTTTIAAMGDFMRAFGVAGSASRAGGILSARWFGDGWKESEAETGVDMLRFWANRNPSRDMLNAAA
jgi:hypothetical protein